MLRTLDLFYNDIYTQHKESPKSVSKTPLSSVSLFRTWTSNGRTVLIWSSFEIKLRPFALLSIAAAPSSLQRPFYPSSLSVTELVSSLPNNFSFFFQSRSQQIFLVLLKMKLKGQLIELEMPPWNKTKGVEPYNKLPDSYQTSKH